MTAETAPSPGFSEDLQALLENLGPLPEPVAYPVLIAVVGLPGTGKSYFSQRVTRRVPLALLETDALRKALVPSPQYTAQESARLFSLVHQLVHLLLERGLPVLLDATNLLEVHREPLYRIARDTHARLVLVQMEAPEVVVRHRLESRESRPQRQDHSDATWEVYQRMRTSVERVRRNHFRVDASQDITPQVDGVVREITRLLRTGR